MAKRKPGSKKTKEKGNGENGGIIALTKELSGDRCGKIVAR
jgi:hypothetical protein